MKGTKHNSGTTTTTTILLLIRLVMIILKKIQAKIRLNYITFQPNYCLEIICTKSRQVQDYWYFKQLSAMICRTLYVIYWWDKLVSFQKPSSISAAFQKLIGIHGVSITDYLVKTRLFVASYLDAMNLFSGIYQLQLLFLLTRDIHPLDLCNHDIIGQLYLCKTVVRKHFW